jgi:glycerophosphoryl diester phosphodiesterase
VVWHADGSLTTQNGGVTSWLDRRVLLYAHQGGAKEAPSSTLFAFRQAVRGGADALEMDVHATADRVLVVTHDETVDRTTASQGEIAALTWAELEALDNAHWWSPGHDAVVGLPETEYPLRGRAPHDRSLGIARLTDVLAEFPDVILNFDIKGTTPDVTPGVTPYEDLLADVLRTYERSDDIIVASFFDDALMRFREIAPEIATSTALGESLQVSRQLRNGQSAEVHPSVVAMQIPYRLDAEPLFGAELVAQVHHMGLAVHVWTIDDEDEMAELIDLGVDGLISDVPSVAQRVMTNRGTPRWQR